MSRLLGSDSGESNPSGRSQCSRSFSPSPGRHPQPSFHCRQCSVFAMQCVCHEVILRFTMHALSTYWLGILVQVSAAPSEQRSRPRIRDLRAASKRNENETHHLCPIPKHLRANADENPIPHRFSRKVGTIKHTTSLFAQLHRSVTCATSHGSCELRVVPLDAASVLGLARLAREVATTVPPAHLGARADREG